jgi:hypothetical protein
MHKTAPGFTAAIYWQHYWQELLRGYSAWQHHNTLGGGGGDAQDCTWVHKAAHRQHCAVAAAWS